MSTRFTKALIIDWETTGLRDEKSLTMPYREGPQGIQLGAVVADIHNDWLIIDQFKVNVRFVGRYAGVSYGKYDFITWDPRAEAIHGLSIQQLLTALSPHEVGRQLGAFLKKHFTAQDRILLCGHNPCSDRYFTMQLLWMSGLLNDPDIHFHHRMLDTMGIGFLIWGAESSDELFGVALGEVRKAHDALEDALLATSVLREAARKLGGIPRLH